MQIREVISLKRNKTTDNPLWTRDFTILTAGSVVSMFGNALAYFAMDLMVLDITGSTLMFAVYNILYMLPNALAPVLIGPFLDRFSRKRTIYTLDFLTAGLFAVLTVLMLTGHAGIYVLAASNLLLGAIGGVYFVVVTAVEMMAFGTDDARMTIMVPATGSPSDRPASISPRKG